MILPRPMSKLVPALEGSHRLLRLAVCCCLWAAGTTAAWGQTAQPSPLPAPHSLPEWTGEIRSARDVTGKASWFKRAVRFVVGLDDNARSILTPNGVHVDAQGHILVADTRARVVHVFDPARRKYQALHPPSSDPFLAPIAVATDASGNIYVSDSVRSRVFVFSPEGKFQRTLGAFDKRESIFQRATGLAIDQKRERLFVVDTAGMRVFILTLDGQVIQRIGRRGVNPGEFNYPTHIAVATDSSFWVTDSLNFRVQHFDAEGRFLSAFGQAGDDLGDFDKAKGIAVGGDNNVYVVEGRNDRVQVYDPTGQLLSVFGRTGQGQGEFFLPTGIAIGAAGQLVIADSFNSRVQLFRLQGSPRPAAGGD
jgi:DNA-binding beta-propeller fold protein YncE